MGSSTGRTFQEESLIPRERYFNDGYFERNQMDSLVSQLICVHDKNIKNILEVGPGNGFVSNFLKAAGYNVTTFDINESLAPDVVGNLTKIETYFEENQFDLILCAEVLEHLDFDNFEPILKQFNFLSSKWIILTLPIRRRTIIDFQFKFKIPFFKPIETGLYWHIPSTGKKWANHHWEINYANYCSLGSLIQLFKKIFNVKNHYIDARNRAHYFFELSVKKD